MQNTPMDAYLLRINMYYEKKKSGEYSKVTSQILYQIVTHTTLKTNGFADADYIRSLMKHALTKRVSISAK